MPCARLTPSADRHPPSTSQLKCGRCEEHGFASNAITANCELAHALVRADRQDDDPEFDAAAEELVAETTAYSVCSSSGIEPGEFSISYLAGWSERTPIATIERTATLIDRLSRRIEDAVATSRSPRPRTTPPGEGCTGGDGNDDASDPGNAAGT